MRFSYVAHPKNMDISDSDNCCTTDVPWAMPQLERCKTTAWVELCLHAAAPAPCEALLQVLEETTGNRAPGTQLQDNGVQAQVCLKIADPPQMV
jgi:hypothetical protein